MPVLSVKQETLSPAGHVETIEIGSAVAGAASRTSRGATSSGAAELARSELGKTGNRMWRPEMAVPLG
jgi:hypothetical protein